jgi:hypothetical protein
MGKEIWGHRELRRGMGRVSLPFIGSGVVRRRDHGGEPVGHGGFHGGQLRKKEEEAVGDRFKKWKMRG